MGHPLGRAREHLCYTIPLIPYFILIFSNILLLGVWFCSGPSDFGNGGDQ